MFQSHHKQQRLIVALLLVVILLISPIVSRSQSMRGAIGISDTATADNDQAVDDGVRRLGWLFDMIQDLANQHKNVTEIAASPTSSPVGGRVPQPLGEEITKKKNGKKKNGKKKNDVV